jgi:hypothetical protein
MQTGTEITGTSRSGRRRRAQPKDMERNLLSIGFEVPRVIGTDSFSVTTKFIPDSLKAPHSKAFEASAVFCQAHDVITKLAMFPFQTDLFW